MELPKCMRALRYSKPGHYEITTVPLPAVRDNDILMKVKVCGVCGTDVHMHDGEFIARYPLTPGHEAVGVVALMGKNVTGYSINERIVADNTEACSQCAFCRRGDALLCEDFGAHGATLNGALAEYCAYPVEKVYKICNLSDVDATLVEPASCVAHGIDRIAPKMGSSILVLGAGPTGLVLAQMLRLNGGAHVVIASPEGAKMRLARVLEVADIYIELQRGNSKPQLDQLKANNPLGFDVVVEATGNADMLDNSIHFVRRGGKLVVYGVYDEAARVSWSPAMIFANEITIIGSFCEMYKFPAAISYLESGKVKVKGIVNKTYKLEQWGKCLDDIRQKRVIKAAVVFD